MSISRFFSFLSHILFLPAIAFTVAVPHISFAAHAPVTGQAVIYSDSMDGKPVVMKSEHYDKNAMTAATHAGFPIGSMVKVTNLKNNKSVVVKVNDRMNPTSKAVIDLSMKAAQEIDMVHDGHVKVRVEIAEK